MLCVICLSVMGCISANDVTEMHYPMTETTRNASYSAGKHLISSDDYGSDMISPRFERTVAYRSPAAETLLSRDSDTEQTGAFWNIGLAEDDDIAESSVTAVITAAAENDIISSPAAPSAEYQISDDKHGQSFAEEHIEPQTENRDGLSDGQSTMPQQQIMTAETKTPDISEPAGGLNKDTVQKQTETKQKTVPKDNNQTAPKEPAFVAARKIDEDALDMTNLKNLKLKEMPQQEQSGITDSRLTLSIAGDQWVLKKMMPDYLELKDRKSSDKQTVFTFDVNAPGEVNLVFVRTDKDAIIRQPYKIYIQDSPSKNDKPKSSDASVQGTGEAAYRAGMAAKRQNKPDEARKHFTEALADPDNACYADALTELIGLYKNDNDADGAARIYNQYATADARQSDDKLNILDYDLLVMNGDYKNAITGYRRFMQDFPQSDLTDKALYCLAYSLEHYKVNPDYREAYRIYNIIIKQYPESKYCKPSQNRSLYLERHYLKIN